MIKYIEYVLKRYRCIQYFYIIFFSAFFKFLGLFLKTDYKKVMLISLKGKNYGDSPKVLYQRMKQDKFFAGYKYTWAFDNPDKYDVDGADKIKVNSLEYFITALRSGIWITNVNIERGLHFKPKKTIFLNTWHGCAPLKKDGNSQKNRNDYDFSKTDIICSASEWQDWFFINSMGAKKESLVRCSMPRNDVLYKISTDDKYILRDKFGIPRNKKVILYAPTWRENIKSSSLIPVDFKYWESKLSDEYIVLFRAHHLMESSSGIEYNNFVRNYSGAYDINELMIIADILITDYSSVMSDFSILEKPVLLYPYDYEEYYSTRGLYKRLEELFPGNVYLNEKDLVKSILSIDLREQKSITKTFKKIYLCPYVNATDKCIETLKEKIIDRQKDV